MGNITTVDNELVKVTHDTLKEFLLKQNSEFWDVDGIYWNDVIGHRPLTVDELIQAIQINGGNSNYIYIFNHVDDGLLETVSNSVWDNVPEISVDKLPNYIISNVKGNDFLYFACSQNAASSGNPITLLPHKGWGTEDDEELDEV